MWVQKGAIQIRGQQLNRSQQGIVGDHQAGRGVTPFYDTCSKNETVQQARDLH